MVCQIKFELDDERRMPRWSIGIHERHTARCEDIANRHLVAQKFFRYNRFRAESRLKLAYTSLQLVTDRNRNFYVWSFSAVVMCTMKM